MNEIRIGHLEVDSPYGNAGGVLKSAEDVAAMARTGVGWLEPGSFTLEKRLGNAWNPETGLHDRVVYHHDSDTGETTNSIGMENQGIDKVEKDIPEMVAIAESFGKFLIVNVAPVSEEPIEESKELVRRAYEAGAHAVILNAGCPNVISEDGGRHEILSRDPAALYTVLAGLTDVVSKFEQIFVRVSPQDDLVNTRNVIRAIEKSQNVSTIFTPNTWPGHRPLDADGNPILGVPGNIGGLSGPATAQDAAVQTDWFAMSTKLDVVSSGGIMNGRELKERMYISYGRRLRKNAVAGAGTTFFYQSEDWKHDVDKLIWEYLDSIENHR